MSAKVSFTPTAQPHDSAQPRLFVPSSALVRENGRLALYVLEGETVQEVSVEEVSKSGGDSEVRGMLTDSAQIVLAPSSSLQAGMRVRSRVP